MLHLKQMFYLISTEVSFQNLCLNITYSGIFKQNAWLNIFALLFFTILSVYSIKMHFLVNVIHEFLSFVLFI